MQPGDTAALAAIRQTADRLHPAGATPANRPPWTDEAALRYLRDPSLRHWIAERHVSNEVLGHVAARVCERSAGTPVMVVTEFGVLPEHRDGLVGIQLIAALSDEAASLGIDEVVALAESGAVARWFRRFGFRRRSGGRLTLAG
ncbi:MAG TPA: GNAT family N-acetyltransferase [Natronosporangium sp.]